MTVVLTGAAGFIGANLVHLRARWPDRRIISVDNLSHGLCLGIDPTRLETELVWIPTISLADGLRRTVSWYIENQELCARLRHNQLDSGS